MALGAHVDTADRAIRLVASIAKDQIRCALLDRSGCLCMAWHELDLVVFKYLVGTNRLAISAESPARRTGPGSLPEDTCRLCGV